MTASGLQDWEEHVFLNVFSHAAVVRAKREDAKEATRNAS